MEIPDEYVPIIVKALELVADTPTMGGAATDVLDYIKESQHG